VADQVDDAVAVESVENELDRERREQETEDLLGHSMRLSSRWAVTGHHHRCPQTGNTSVPCAAEPSNPAQHTRTTPRSPTRTADRTDRSTSHALTARSALTKGERLFIGWVAPRGIVAAATASTFGAELVAHHVDGTAKILPATFLVIVLTVSLYG
jgi:hypothetical protein